MVANGFEGVPWMVGGGAKHSANVGRVVSYGAFGGVSGVFKPGDWKVAPTTPTANMQVHVATGAGGIVNGSANAQSEGYIARAPAVSDITIAPTGGAARSDLIVVRIKDPQYAPWTNLYTNPTDIANGPYAFPEVISGVANTITRAEQLNLAQSLYAVARIDIPANTTTAITSAMIKDLRQLTSPHYLPVNDLQAGNPAGDFLLTTDTAIKNWPSKTLSVNVPTWATWADITVDLLAFGVSGPANFDSRIQFGALTGAFFAFDYNGAANVAGTVETVNWSMFAGFDVTSLQGTTQVLRTNARRTFATEAPGSVAHGLGALVRFRVEFFEKPI